jgi:hypothetical protein
MNFETIKEWLMQSTNRQIRNCRIMGIVGFVFCPGALAVASALVYCILRVITYHRYGADSKNACLWISVGMIPLMFIGNRFVPTRNLMEERMSEGPSTSLIGHELDKRQVQLQCFLWILFAGPRLLNWASNSFREIKRLQQRDAHSCAAVLYLLLGSHKKVPYDDIARELPWLDMATAIDEVQKIPGVVTLPTNPAGLSLTQELRTQIRTGTFA